MVLPGRFRQCHCYVPPVPERGPDSDRASLLQVGGADNPVRGSDKFVLPVLTVLKSRRINDDLVLRRLPGNFYSHIFTVHAMTVNS
jgi:hypothetical protein